MNKQIESLISDYFPDDKTKAEHLLQAYSAGLLSQIEKYADSQYRKFKISNSSTVRDDPWVLGTSEGADYCIGIIKSMLDEV